MDEPFSPDVQAQPPTPPTPPSARYPVVAIVGRPNVGKSSLLNALARRKVAIVQDQPGVTRDRVSVPLEVDGRWVELVDTGGWGFDDPQGLTDPIRRQIESAMKRADLVLFVVDAHAGLLADDLKVAELLRTLGKQVVLLSNKADAPRHDLSAGDFARLGFGSPVPVSATTGRNIGGMGDLVAKHVDLRQAPTRPPEPDLKIAIVGKRNAGKSTLVNAIARAYETNADDEGGDGRHDRVIVSEIPGTTRDSVDVVFFKDGRTMTVIDTAGVRKKRHMVTDDIEFYSYHRAQRSVRRADVVLLLIDAVQPVSEPDKKLAQYLVEQEKPTIIVLNKWDLAREQARGDGDPAEFRDTELMEEFRDYIDKEFPGLSFAPVAFVTASEGRSVAPMLDLCRNLAKQARERVSTGQLNAALRAVLEERPPGGGSGRKRPKIFYATQVDVEPPHVVIFVNDPDVFDQGYRRYLSNRFRDLLPFEEVPIRLTLRARSQDDSEEAGTANPRRRSGNLRSGKRSKRPASPGRKAKPGATAKRRRPPSS